MNKQIMITVSPKEALNILNGKAVLLLRKYIPKNYKGWVNVYVTNGVGKSKYHHLYNLTEYNNGKTLFSITHHNKHSLVPDGFLNGKVVARFWFEKYEELKKYMYYQNRPIGYDYDLECTLTMVEKMCITYEEMLKTARKKQVGQSVYAWHIDKFQIFDKPKELSSFYSPNLYATMETINKMNDEDRKHYQIKQAPKKYIYVWEKE